MMSVYVLLPTRKKVGIESVEVCRSEDTIWVVLDPQKHLHFDRETWRE